MSIVKNLMDNSMWTISSHIVSLVLLLLFVIFFQEPLIKLYPDSGVKYIDELFILGYLLFIVSRALIFRRLTPLFIISVLALSYMMIISLIGYQQSIPKILTQSVIHWKFFIFVMILDSIMLLRPSGDAVRRFFKIVAVFSIIGLVANLVLQEQFLDFFSVPAMYRAGVLRIQGFQLKPNDLAIHLGVMYIYLFIVSNNSSVYRMVLLTILFSILIVLNGSRAAMTAIPLTLIFYVIYMKQWKILLVLIVISVLGVTILGDTILDMVQRTTENIAELSDIQNTFYIRGIMIYYGFVLLMNNFPIGTGAATFGSTESGGSVVYDWLGLSGMKFFENLVGIYDSNLASISGEFGVVGLMIFSASLYYVYRKSTRNAGSDRRQKLYLRVILAYLILISIVNPLFMYSYNAVLFALAFRMVGVGNNLAYFGAAPLADKNTSIK